MSCPTGYNTVYKNNITEHCTDTPKFWYDNYGDTCNVYERNNYCTTDGQPTGNWNSQWGTFNSVGNPDIHCCSCGGGIKFQISQGDTECKCPEGSSEVNGVCQPSDLDKVVSKIGESPIQVCTSKPFVDRMELTCDYYRKNMICDPSAVDKKGLNWDNLFDTAALDNCCECGGGDRSTVNVPLYGVIKNCPDDATYSIEKGDCVCNMAGEIFKDGVCILKNCSNDSIYSIEKDDCVCNMEGTVFKDGVCQYPSIKCEDSTRKMNPIVILGVLTIVIILLYSLFKNK